MTTTLFFRPGSCALAPHTVLKWTGLPHQVKKAARNDPELLAISPAGVVPALITSDGRPLTQCSAILQHIALAAGRAELLGDGDAARRDEVAMWLGFFTGDFHPSFWPYFAPMQYLDEEGVEHHPAVIRAAHKLIGRGLSKLDAHLRGRDQLVGSEKTVVDAYAVPMLRWAKGIRELDFQAYEHVARFYRGMAEDAGVREAMAEHGISP
ncbi:MAG TPA: glutathione S-transferase N-terminal domain-containing protein [Polyangiaceae bacterium]|nr:glutathione S-transferase N-terminal domain-containing protein [Polyangiaceae bacterium]